MPSMFTPQKVKPIERDFGNCNIVTRKVIDAVTMTGEKDTDFVLKKKVVETSKVDLDEYVNSFAEDVGILNVFRKVAATGDTTLINERTRVPGKVDENGFEEINDISKVPSDYMDVKKAVDSANNVKLDPELKKALQNMSDAELNEYIKTRYAKKEEKKEEDN